MVLGDFNCTPVHVPRHTGYELPRAKLYADAAEFSTILEAHQLVALNTWSRRRSLDTFVGSKHKSLIDFALTRRGHADLEARRSIPLKDVTFSPWRMGGRHYPVQASLPLHPGWQRASVRPATQPRPSYDSQALNQAVRDKTSSYQALRTTFEHRLSQLQAPTLRQLNDLLLEVVCKLFPKRPTATIQRAWQTEEVQISAADMWRARKRMQHTTGNAPQSFRQCFQAWLRHRDFQKAYKALKRKGKEARTKSCFGTTTGSGSRSSKAWGSRTIASYHSPTGTEDTAYSGSYPWSEWRNVDLSTGAPGHHRLF